MYVSPQRRNKINRSTNFFLHTQEKQRGLQCSQHYSPKKMRKQGKENLGANCIPLYIAPPFNHRLCKTQQPEAKSWKSFKSHNRYKRMHSKKLLCILLFITSTFSFLKLFRITTNTASSSPIPSPPALLNACIYGKHATAKQLSLVPHTLKHYTTSPPTRDNLTPKELHLLCNLISQRVPCNLLFFGFKPQFLNLSRINTGGTTIFLEDDAEKLKVPKIKGVKIYWVKYRKKASEAYDMLKHAREHSGCMLGTGNIHNSSCKLALTALPKKVYQKKWDVVMVDGPRGDQPEALGRMEAIYTAAVLARAGNMTDVVVHDVDRVVEKWYSWEFLCHENLVSSKGRLWHFRVKVDPSSSRFCPVAAHQIE